MSGHTGTTSIREWKPDGRGNWRSRLDGNPKHVVTVCPTEPSARDTGLSVRAKPARSLGYDIYPPRSSRRVWLTELGRLVQIAVPPSETLADHDATGGAIWIHRQRDLSFRLSIPERPHVAAQMEWVRAAPIRRMNATALECTVHTS